MWDGVEEYGHDLTCLVNNLCNSTVLKVKDSSHYHKVAPMDSVTGWVLLCTSIQCTLHGNFCKIFKSASLYHSKLLGLLANHTLLAKVHE